MDDVPRPVGRRSGKLMDRFRAWLRENHYLYPTEQTYVHWVVKYIRFHRMRHPRDMGGPEISAFLSFLTVQQNASPGTQKIALNALNCFYRKFLGIDFGELQFQRSPRQARVPNVFTPSEARAVIEQLDEPARLIAEVMYGAGLRVSEALRLRIKDLDFQRGQIIVREGKGSKDRVTMLPRALSDRLMRQVEVAERLYEMDRANGVGPAWMPHRLARKYPGAGSQKVWQFIFPSEKPARDPQTGIIRRHHYHPDNVRKHIKRAATACGIRKQCGTPHLSPFLRNTTAGARV